MAFRGAVAGRGFALDFPVNFRCGGLGGAGDKPDSGSDSTTLTRIGSARARASDSWCRRQQFSTGRELACHLKEFLFVKTTSHINHRA